MIEGKFGKSFNPNSFVEVAAADIRDVVQEPVWQELRASFIGTWKHEPEANVEKLKNYLGKNPSARKLRIVKNYLTGTTFRTKTVTSHSIDILPDEVKTKYFSQLEKEKSE